jgi:hypothetical protein
MVLRVMATRAHRADCHDKVEGDGAGAGLAVELFEIEELERVSKDILVIFW